MDADDLARFRQWLRTTEDALREVAEPNTPDDAVEARRRALEGMHAVRQEGMAARALLAADRHYLDAVSQRTIAGELGIAVNAVSLWIKKDGPQQYLAVARRGQGFQLREVPVQPGETSQRELAAMREDGWRIAPATWKLREAGVADPEALWNRLERQSW